MRSQPRDSKTNHSPEAYANFDSCWPQIFNMDFARMLAGQPVSLQPLNASARKGPGHIVACCMQEAILTLFFALINIWTVNAGHGKIDGISESQLACALKRALSVKTISPEFIAVVSPFPTLVDVGTLQWTAKQKKRYSSSSNQSRHAFARGHRCTHKVHSNYVTEAVVHLGTTSVLAFEKRSLILALNSGRTN